MADPMTTMLGLFAAFMGVMIVVGLAVYIFTALVLMALAKKTNTPRGWLGFIPIGNLYLMTAIGKTPWWTIFGVLLAWIPILGGIVALGLMVYWWLYIARAIKKPEWWGVLCAIPVVGWVFMGMMAWGK
ncbi:MAG: hypothetical protein V1735_00630 [Nanoarchaeota archaeon]